MYQPRYIASVYYAPDDPHVTNPSQPGYVGSNTGNGGYSGSGGGGGGGNSGSTLSDILKLNAPGAPIPGGGTQPGTFGPGGSSGQQGAYDPLGNIKLDNGSSTVNGQVPSLFLSPAGQQAPVDQWNADMSTGQLYPPGTAAPAEGFQLSSNVLGPTALAMSALMAAPPPGQFNADYYVAADPAGGYDIDVGGEKRHYGTENEAERAYNDMLTAAGVKGYSNAAQGQGTAAPAAPTADVEHSPTVMNQVYSQNGTEFLTRAEMQDRLRAAGNAQDLNAMTNTQLAQMMSGAYSTGQANQQMQQQQKSQQIVQAGDELKTLETLLAAAPAMAPQLVPIINALLATMGLPQLPANEAQLLESSLAGSSLGGRAAPAHINFAPLGG